MYRGVVKIGYGTAWNMAQRFMARNKDEHIQPQIDKCTQEK